MKDFLDKIPITTILISYLFICGGLYLIGFWTTFEIDVTSFVSLTDIPKSFVLPFVLTNGFYLLNLGFNIITTTLTKDEVPTEEPSRRVRIFWKIFETLIIVTFFVAIILFQDNRMSMAYWWTFASIFSFMLSIKFTRLKILQKYVPYFQLRFYIVSILIVLPISCFSIGKILSLKIYHNENVMTLKNPIGEIKNEQLKFVGFIGDKLIVASMDNKKIVFINQASKDSFELVRK